MTFEAKPQLIDIGAGDLIAQYIKDDPTMVPLNDNAQGVMNEAYPSVRLLGGLYYAWRRISPVQVQVLLFDGFDYIRITQDHDQRELRIGLTQCLKTASAALGDVDPAVYEAIWDDVVNS
jgi:hypothetical protein